MVTALVTPMTCAMAEDFGTMVGMDALLDAVLRALGDAEQLDAVAEFVGHRRSSGVIDVMPSTWIASASIRVPKARLVRIASLWAVSKPPTSKVGSASA